jgi:hypothetical protein
MSARGSISPEHAEPVRDEQGAPGGEVRSDVAGVNLAVSHVGRKERDELCLARRLRRIRDAEAVGQRPLLGGAALPCADDYSEAAVAQVARMGAALAAIADDRYGRTFQARLVGVIVAVNPRLIFHFGVPFRAKENPPLRLGSGGSGFRSF